MNTIPRNHRADEFTLSLKWRPQFERSFKGIPGLYLTAGYSNEGEATWIADGVRLGAQAIQNALTMLSGDPSVSSELMNHGGPLIDAHDKALHSYHAGLVRRARSLREELAAAEAALAQAGLEGAL